MPTATLAAVTSPPSARGPSAREAGDVKPIHYVRRVKDPFKRATSAVEVLRQAQERAATLRVMRNAAMIALMGLGAPPAAAYKAGQINRNAFAKIRNRIAADDGYAERVAVIGGFPNVETLRAANRREAGLGPHIAASTPYVTSGATAAMIPGLVKEIAAADAMVEEVRRIRDDVALPILAGDVRHPDGRTWTNTEVAALLGVTPERVMQMRVGER